RNLHSFPTRRSSDLVVFGVIMLCVSLLRGRPFMPVMVRTLVATSFALVISGMLSTGLLAFANMEVAHLLDLPGFPMAGNLDFTRSEEHTSELQSREN